MSQLFLGGFALYAVSLAFAEGHLGYKLLMLLRDLVVLGAVSQLFGLLKKYRIAFILLLAVCYGGWFLFYGRVMQQTFPQQSKFDASIPLDENGELLIELKQQKQLADLQKVLEKYGLLIRPAFQMQHGGATDLDDYFLVNVPQPATSDLPGIEKALLSTGLIDWIEENEVVSLSPLEEQPAMPSRRNYRLNDPGIRELWGFDKMEVDKLFDLIEKSGIKPQRKAKVFILDTGVDAGHEDLRDNFVSLKTTYDNDPVGHGTHCAGIAAAVSNNGLGIASFSPDNQFVEITSIKVLNAAGRGTQQSIIQGMLEAADAKADVISMSLGGLSTRLSQRAYEQAVSYANQAGTIVVVAAGNNNQNARNFSPANVTGVIAVSAVDTSLNKANFSNFVKDIPMAVAAPGVSIYSTLPSNSYGALNGTSMATPYVSGLVGIMKSIQPKLTTAQVYKVLHDAGYDTGNTAQTGKLIAPAAAIEELLD
jgi:thermitase